MYPNLVEFNIPTHSERWFQFRTVGIPEHKGGIGASETAKICGYDKYPPVPIKVYHEKVGTEDPDMWDNERMLHGRLSEPLIIAFGKLYDGTKESYVQRIERFLSEGEPDKMCERMIHRVRSYVVNPKYPWLFVSLDGALDKDAYSLITGEKLNAYCPYEIKTIEGRVAQQYDSDFPPKYIYQINQQMLVTETNYGEIAVLKDGKYFDIHPIERNEEICEEIIAKTKDFWFNRVVPGREWFKSYRDAQISGDRKKMEVAKAHIMSLEPPVDGSDETRKYMTRRVQQSHEEGETKLVRGNVTQYMKIRHYTGMNEVKKLLESDLNKVKSSLMSEMAEQRTRFLSFGEEGKIQITRDGKFRSDMEIDLEEEAIKAYNLLDLKKFE